jgi:hypothetical protein
MQKYKLLREKLRKKLNDKTPLTKIEKRQLAVVREYDAKRSEEAKRRFFEMAYPSKIIRIGKNNVELFYRYPDAVVQLRKVNEVKRSRVKR